MLPIFLMFENFTILCRSDVMVVVMVGGEGGQKFQICPLTILKLFPICLRILTILEG
jgi:hypothetical protein